MFGSIRKFVRNTRGAFAMQFALMVVPLCVCTGLAIDGGRAFLAHFELASALDAAALAVGSTTKEGSDLNSVAKKFVESNFKTQHDEPIELELVSDDDKAVLKGTVKINTFFMPLVGQNTVTVSAESEVRRGGNSVEVAMALDITGSMNATRIAGLKAAAKVLVDEVVGILQTPYFSKVAVVPWSQQVYVGTKHADASVPTELRATLTPATGISAATWRPASATTKTISSAGWRTNTGKSISAATWKNGSAIGVTKITKVTSGSSTRVQITYSAGSSTYYANGDTIYLTGAGGSYTAFNNKKYKVADRTSSSPYTFNLMDYGTSTYSTPPSGNTNSTAGSVQRCLYTTCELQVTANTHGFSNNSLIYITGVSTSGSGTAINNTWGTTWTVTSRDSNNFTLNGTDGTTMLTYSSGGTASECYTTDCRYRVVTSASHGFATSDKLFMWGVTQSGSGLTTLITAANNSFSMYGSTVTPTTVTALVSTPAATFYLPNNGNTYKTWSSGGSVAQCLNTTCNVEVTSNSHGLATGDNVEILNVAGLTGINTNSSSRYSWTITRLSSNSFSLNDTTPALSNMSGTYSSSGTAQCLTYGCAKMRLATDTYTDTLYLPSPCMVERYGANAATDVSPATSPLGTLYTSDGTCTTTNYVTPLTADKTRLNTSIDDLKTGGSTAGQIGLAWAWYMLSPNFASVWDKEATNAPKTYETKELVKVAILMTDGEFNYSTCQGVQSGSNCTAAKDPFDQARDLCTAMKDKKIVIYTVGLQLNTALEGDDFLTECATDPSHAFLAADEDELKVAFKKIATSISKLRLSK